MPFAPRQFSLASQSKGNQKSKEAFNRCKKYRTKSWGQIRMEVIARDMAECQMCHRLCLNKGEAHVDHIKPVASGGTDDQSNLRTLCKWCHNKRTAGEQNAAK